MTKEEFFNDLKNKFQKILIENNLQNEDILIDCKALSAIEAIGTPKKKDYPIISGKDIMIQAIFKGAKGQAFTDSPTGFTGTLAEILEMDIINDDRSRSLFIATLNAVLRYLGLICGTVHCKTEGPELCAGDVLSYLQQNYAYKKKILLVGFQPSFTDKLKHSEFDFRVLDLNPANIGNIKYDALVEDGNNFTEPQKWADLILCTGSSICNGTIVNYLDLNTEVIFFGMTIAGAAYLMNLHRLCYANKYSE